MTANILPLGEARMRAELRALARRYPELTSPEAQARLAAYLRTKGGSTMAKPREGRRLSANLGIRMAPEDLARLDAVADRIPLASRHAVARAAMRIGLRTLEEDPARILTEGALAPPEQAKRRR